jgi:hypothetical protein
MPPNQSASTLQSELGFSGRDRAFFFLNYEELREPQAQQRTRGIFNTLLLQGIYPYTVAGKTVTVDLMALAAANGQTATFDPTIKKILTDINDVSLKSGTIKPRADPAVLDYLFTNNPMSVRKAPTARFDFNLTSSHRIEGSWSFMQYPPWLDTLNNADNTFPDFPNFGTQLSNRYSFSVALRSTLTPRLVNEARFGMSVGSVLFWLEINAGQFTGTSVANQDGFALGISAAGIQHRFRCSHRKVYRAGEQHRLHPGRGRRLRPEHPVHQGAVVLEFRPEPGEEGQVHRTVEFRIPRRIHQRLQPGQLQWHHMRQHQPDLRPDDLHAGQQPGHPAGRADQFLTVFPSRGDRYGRVPLAPLQSARLRPG